MNETSQREHRVGTLTLGLGLIMFGILFLLRLIWPEMDCLFIWRLWPVILILLGIEVLLSCRKNNVIYDKWGIIILMCLLIFSMCMGFMDTAYARYCV